jgi:hypothetical protein
MKPEEHQQAHIDLSALTKAELDILLRLAQSGRLTNVPAESEDDAPIIQAKAE